jgi:hypothetical protein
MGLTIVKKSMHVNLSYPHIKNQRFSSSRCASHCDQGCDQGFWGCDQGFWGCDQGFWGCDQGFWGCDQGCAFSGF